MWTKIAALAVVSALLATSAQAQSELPPAPEAPLEHVLWLSQPHARDYLRAYPPAAYAEHISGAVVIECLVLDDRGRLDCAVVSEEPEGYGFGAATLRLQPLFRVGPETLDGVPTEGRRIRRTIRWMSS